MESKSEKGAHTSTVVESKNSAEEDEPSFDGDEYHTPNVRRAMPNSFAVTTGHLRRGSRQDYSRHSVALVGIEKLMVLDQQQPIIRRTSLQITNAATDDSQKQKATAPVEDKPSSQKEAEDEPKQNYKRKSKALGNILDVQMAMKNLEEAGQMQGIVKEFGKDYNTAMNKVNQFDLSTLESDIASQSLKLCYKMVHENLHEAKPDFDNDNNMASKLDQLIGKVTQVDKQLQQFKEEFIAINKSVINQDIRGLEIEKIKKQKEKQDNFLIMIPSHEDGVNTIQTSLKALKTDYEEFEKKLFDEKNEEVQTQINAANGMIQQIADTQQQLLASFIKAKQDVSAEVPFTREQRQELQRLQSELTSLEKQTEDSITEIAVHIKKKDEIEGRFKAMENIRQYQKTEDLSKMIQQSKDLHQLVENYNQWQDLNEKIKKLQERVKVTEGSLASLKEQISDYIADLMKRKKAEFGSLIKQICDLSEKVGPLIDVQKKRLDTVEDKFKPDSIIPEGDLTFINNQVSRYRDAISQARTVNDTILADAKNIDQKLQKNDVSSDDLQNLKDNLQNLKKQETVDIPRIARNIDSLEGFSLKALKQQINDDNKKSQTQISKMKKNFEDLQKQIDAITAKHQKTVTSIGGLQKNFTNPDLERTNEIKNRLEDPAEKSGNDIKGENNSKSLQAQRKTIVGKINILVSQFNEIIQMIKDCNKNQDNEQIVLDLIKQNATIKDECQKIEKLTADAREFGSSIDADIDQQDKDLVVIKAKYEEKNNAVEKCRERHHQIVRKIEKVGKDVTALESKVQRIADRLKGVDLTSQMDEDFCAEVKDQAAAVRKILQEYELVKSKLDRSRHKCNNQIVPLSELGSKVVSKQEIDTILKSLQDVDADFTDEPMDAGKITKIQKEVDELLQNDKSKRMEDAVLKMGEISKKIEEVQALRDKAVKKMNDLKHFIIQQKMCQPKDSDLMSKLRKMDIELKGTDRELQDLESQLKELVKARIDIEISLDDAMKNPNKYSPDRVETVLQNIEGAEQKADQLEEQFLAMITLLENKFKWLDDLLRNADLAKDAEEQIGQIQQELAQELNTYQSLLKSIPEKINQVEATLKEMRTGSGPDETADYCDERQSIERNLQDLQKIRQELNKMEQDFAKKKDDIDYLKDEKYKQSEELPTQLEEHKELRIELQVKVNEAIDLQDDVEKIRTKMGDCQIPINIARRAFEIDQLKGRLERMKGDFRDLKSADDDYEGDQKTERTIKKSISQVGLILRGFDQETADLQKYQNYPLHKYQEFEFVSYENQQIIINVRDHQAKIADINRRLDELDDMMQKLNAKLIQQDMENATKILVKKSRKLKERLQKALEKLERIRNCCNQLDGNTSHELEEDLVEIITGQLPESFKDIECNFDLLDNIEKMLERSNEKQTYEKITQLKQDTDEAVKQVDKTENNINNHEKSLFDLNAFKKVCARDEELEQIDKLLAEFREHVTAEQTQIERDLIKNEQKQQTEGDPTGKLADLKGGILNYIGDLNDLEASINSLQTDKTKCFKKFDDEIPKSVKNERLKRGHIPVVPEKGISKTTKTRKATKTAIERMEMQQEASKPTDMFSLMATNCHYKKPILKLLKELRIINNKKKELDSKYEQLKIDLSKIKKVSLYKAVKGDPVDELFAEALNRHQCSLPVKRISPGKYMFGTRQIHCKIINGKLVVRVGGGYMNVDEFIVQYAQIEVTKLQKIAKAEEKHGEDDHQCKQEKYGLQAKDAEEAKAPPTIQRKSITGSGNKKNELKSDNGSPKTTKIKLQKDNKSPPLNSTKKSEKKKITGSTATPLKGSKNTSTTKKATEGSTNGSKYGKSPQPTTSKIPAKTEKIKSKK